MSEAHQSTKFPVDLISLPPYCFHDLVLRHRRNFILIFTTQTIGLYLINQGRYWHISSFHCIQHVSLISQGTSSNVLTISVLVTALPPWRIFFNFSSISFQFQYIWSYRYCGCICSYNTDNFKYRYVTEVNIVTLAKHRLIAPWWWFM